LAQEFCGAPKPGEGYGPFDYRVSKDKLPIIESNHFTPDVEALRQGSTGSLGSDIGYTLRAFPNHPRALMAMANLSIKTRTKRPPGAHFSVECYFDRALQFAPDDGWVRMVHGIYLSKIGKTHEALEQFQQAQTFVGDSAVLHYNLGLAYFDVGDYENALTHAQHAYQLGFQLPGLKNKLAGVRRWKEPPSRTGDKAEERVGRSGADAK